MTLIPPTELRQDLTGRNRLMRVGRIQYTLSSACVKEIANLFES